MLQICFDRDINRLILETDDPTAHFFLESKHRNYEYIHWRKEYGWVEKVIKIYDKGKTEYDGIYRYKIGVGWVAYLMQVFKEGLSVDNYDFLAKMILMSDNYKQTPFKELRDYQNSDVLHFLKYRFGLITVNTGWGKTQVIATLTNYAHEVLGKRVLLVTPNSKARDELVKRCLSVFHLDVSNKEKDVNGHLDCIITSGLMNTNKMKNPELQKKFRKLLSEYEWVLVDEVEYTINDGGKFIYDNCTGAERMYGFSGTADKTAGEVISFRDGLGADVVMRNKDLIKYFGPSLVYRMPTNLALNFVTIKTAAMDKLQLDNDAIDASGNVYAEIMSQIWSNPEICKVIVKMVKRFPLVFMPMNNLVNILYTWINDYFLGRFRILLVCGEGYIYYDINGNTSKLTLAEACQYIKDGKVDVIPSTSSGYRALDLPGLKNIAIFSGKVAGVTLQCVGRTARGEMMNIITLAPIGKRKIPVYTNGSKERDEMIRNYYNFCDITDTEILEYEL